MGQVDYTRGIVFGGNYTMLNWQPEPAGQITGKLRFSFGGLLNVKLSEEIQFETDVLVNWWTAEVKDINANLYNLWVLSLPVLLKGTFPAESNVPFVGIGPEFGWVLSHTVTVGPDGWPEKVEEQKETTVALTFCGGVDIKAGEGIITPEVRYSLGLTDLSKDSARKNKYNQWLFLLGMKW
jgi:hypothetical protein